MGVKRRGEDKTVYQIRKQTSGSFFRQKWKLYKQTRSKKKKAPENMYRMKVNGMEKQRDVSEKELM